ncbi:hypothetical protein ACS0TY_032159 [Phlomoides rotata]
MSYSLGLSKKMIVFVFIVVLVFVESRVSANFDLMGELSGREEWVNWAGYGEQKLSTVVVGGTILCHGADAKHKTSLHPYPVSGAKVAVLCGTSKAWGDGSTDSSGNFLIDLPSHLHAIPNLEKVCCVNVVHLPETSPCRSGLHKGIKLSSIGDGTRTYTAHNIHLMPQKHT